MPLYGGALFFSAKCLLKFVHHLYNLCKSLPLCNSIFKNNKKLTEIVLTYSFIRCILIPRCNNGGANVENELKYANSNIKLLLEYNNWTQAILCKKTGITPVTMRRKLNSKIPKWSMLEAVSIANAFGMTVQEIFLTKLVPKCNKEADIKSA
jgi:lambda repressor-like predicted transcriptional regulator